MKKYLMYLAIAALVVIVAFFAYKKIYGMGGFYAEKRATPVENVEQNAEMGATTAKGMFSE